MSTPTATLVRGAFSPAQGRALRTLRARYRIGHDHFSAQELAHLRFLRWLHQTGRLAS